MPPDSMPRALSPTPSAYTPSLTVPVSQLGDMYHTVHASKVACQFCHAIPSRDHPAAQLASRLAGAWNPVATSSLTPAGARRTIGWQVAASLLHARATVKKAYSRREPTARPPPSGLRLRYGEPRSLSEIPVRNPAGRMAYGLTRGELNVIRWRGCMAERNDG